MAAKIWYYPSNVSNTAREITFGRPLTARKGPTDRFMQSISEGFAGQLATVQYGGRTELQVEFTMDMRGVATGTGRTLRRSLVALINHLQRGGYCVLAEDATYAFAAFAPTIPGNASILLSYTSNVLESLAGAVVDLSARELYVQSDYSDHYVEMLYAASHNTTAKTISVQFPGTVFDYTDTEWFLIREAGTYPALRIPKDKRNNEFLTHESENTLYLTLPLEEDPSVVNALAASSVTLASTTGGADWGVSQSDPLDYSAPTGGLWWNS